MTSLDLIAIVVHDYDPAIQFFVDILGFDLVEDSPFTPTEIAHALAFRGASSRRTMPLIRRAGWLMATALLLACSSDGITGPKAGFGHASVMFACGPADGPATAIYLTPVEYTAGPVAAPSIGIYIDQPLENLAGQTWDLSAASAAGTAWYQSDPGTFVKATAGSLTVSSIGSDKSVEGVVDLSIPGLPRITGSIHAIWIPSGATCV